MCGIAGFREESRKDEGIIRAMVGSLKHRGPDDDGFFSQGPFQGGMRRLSINDLENGRQPLTNEDGSIVLFYNGEIYNYPALRKELEAKGHRFHTRSDGEVICHLYEEEGESLFERLDGMFAVALWIGGESKLILARDIPGEKPLYYGETSSGGIAFASEIKGLRHFPGLDLSFDRQALWDFPTFLWIPEPASAYAGIKALPRGHMLVVDRRGKSLRSYPNRFNPAPLHYGSGPDADKSIALETRRVVEESVKSRLLSDVPLGSFLSGGLDSSIITTLASRELGDLSTFTIGFEDVEDPYHGRADEASQAEELARRLGTHHHCLRVTADTFRSLLPEFCEYGDGPFAVSSGLGILAISRLARERGIKVLLSGDGADECFGGYSWYSHLDAVNSMPALGYQPENGHAISCQNTGLSLDHRLDALRGYGPQKRAWAWHYYASEGEKSRLFTRDFGEGLHSSLRHFHAYKEGAAWTNLDFISQDRDFYFPQEMLRKVDRMTMAFSVEGRAPFAAPAVLAHAGKLRFDDMVRPGRLKHVLRQAFSDILPPEVLARPKHGFNVPIDLWLKGEWSDLLDSACSADSRLSRTGWLSPDWGDKARDMLRDPERLNGHTVFCYIMLDRWLEGLG